MMLFWDVLVPDVISKGVDCMLSIVVEVFSLAEFLMVEEVLRFNWVGHLPPYCIYCIVFYLYCIVFGLF